jgi:hypothetical protein
MVTGVLDRRQTVQQRAHEHPAPINHLGRPLHATNQLLKCLPPNRAPTQDSRHTLKQRTQLFLRQREGEASRVDHHPDKLLHPGRRDRLAGLEVHSEPKIGQQGRGNHQHEQT